jgi:hypothetical protein
LADVIDQIALSSHLLDIAGLPGMIEQGVFHLSPIGSAPGQQVWGWSQVPMPMMENSFLHPPWPETHHQQPGSICIRWIYPAVFLSQQGHGFQLLEGRF